MGGTCSFDVLAFVSLDTDKRTKGESCEVTTTEETMSPVTLSFVSFAFIPG